MKTRFFILSCFLACLCFSGCNENENITKITGITVSPAIIPPMEIGDEVELTATFSPSNSNEEIIWVSWNDEILSIESHGATAKLKAINFGQTRIFATSASKIVVSPDIPITINSDDYAALLVGSYLGVGKSGLGPIPDMKIKLERVGLLNSTVKLTVEAEMAPFGEQIIIGETINLSVGKERGTYNLDGNAQLVIPGMITFNFVVSGTFNNDDKSLTLKLDDSKNSGFPLVIDIDAVPGSPIDFGEAAAGVYTGKANGTSAIGAITGLDMDVTLTRISSNRVDLFISSPMGNITLKEGQEIEVSAGVAANTCALTGNAYMAAFDMEMTVKGTVNLLEHTLTMELEGAFMSAVITAELDIAKIVAGEYIGDGALSGLMDMPLSNVPITMERKNKTTVNMFASTALATIDCDLTVAPDGNKYSLLGETSIMGMDFTVTGTHNPSTQTFTVSINNPALQIDLTAAKR